MKIKISHYLKILIFCTALFTQLIPEQILAGPRSGLGRVRQCAPNGFIDPSDGLDFNPTSGGKDSEWVLSNPVCLSVMAYSYVGVKAAIYTMNNTCGLPRPPRIMPSIFSDIGDIARASAASSTTNPGCATAVVAANLSLTRFLWILGVIYAISKDAYRSTKICGNDWLGPNTTEYNLYGKAYETRIIEGYPTDINSTKKIVDFCSSAQGKTTFEGNHNPKTCATELSFEKKHFREYFFGGVEVDDDAIDDQACYDPYRPVSSTSSSNPTVEHRYHKQRYYMRGYEEGNFNCQKYRITNNIDPLSGLALTPSRADDFKNAYACCLNRSSNYVCINYKGKQKFCKADSQCTISVGTDSAEDSLSTNMNFVTFQTRSRERRSKICVETYSLCPYNFYIQGGSDICDYYQDKGITTQMVKDGTCAGSQSEVRNDDCSLSKRAGKCKNYCQYMRHCVKTSNTYVHNFSDASPYFSEACINFSGDSRNRIGYGSGFFQGSMRHFSAPIVQCFKETLENVFHNRAGHSRCLSNDENAGIDITGICPAGFDYQKGQKVKQKSFFEKFQETLTSAIKIALTLVITFYGMKILLAQGEVKKKDLMMLIVKIAVVMYFATGTAWKDAFFDGIYNTSNFFAELVFRVQMPDEEYKRDGCQFGNVYLSSSQGSVSTTSASGAYPAGKSYLAIWDSLDCKLARYMGFGPSVSVANIALLIIAGWLIGPIGSYFVTCIFIFAFLMISMIIRAVHIFLASSLAIILLIFISPITITCILTDKTKDIFNNWLKQLLSYTVQPMILFIYLAIMIAILDKSLVGSARYSGSAPAKTINCTSYCVESNGNPAIGVDLSNCNTNNRTIVNPRSDSFECLINADEFSRFPGLELIGISIPFLVDLFTSDPRKKMLTLVRGLLIIYFLYKFMDEVPNIAAQLFGGSALNQSGPKVGDMFKNVRGKLKGLQQRGGRMAAGSAKTAGRSALREMRRGKDKKESSSKDSGSDASPPSSGGSGGGDSSGGGSGGGGGSSEA